MRLKKNIRISLVFFFAVISIGLSAQLSVSPCDDPDNVTDFINPPSSIIISCDEWQAFTPVTLEYFNNQEGVCEISGSVSATTSDIYDHCGNDITYIWEYTDVCGRSISHSQVVTINPLLIATFVDPPSDLTINCDELETFTPIMLPYTNGSSGACLIEGTIEAEADDTFDICGSLVTYEWIFVDDCGRTIIHSQTVTLSPVFEASFINPPGNITITCEEWQSFIPATLSFINDQNGSCEISGSASAFTADSLICGNEITYNWEFTDYCGRPISHTQVVTVESALSSKSITKDNILIYPNPTSNLISIKSEYKITVLKLYTTTGNNLFQSRNININNFEIDLSIYPSDLYLLQVETENGRWVEKVIRR